MSRETVLAEIMAERERQLAKWGKQHRPNVREGQDQAARASIRDYLRKRCDESEERGPFYGFTGGASWQEILEEECWESYAEDSKDALRKELIQVAAVAVAWIEDLDEH